MMWSSISERGLPRSGKWQGVELSSDNFRQLYHSSRLCARFLRDQRTAPRCSTSAPISIRRRTSGALSGTIRLSAIRGRCPLRSSRQKTKPIGRLAATEDLIAAVSAIDGR